MAQRIGLADVMTKGCAKPSCRWNRASLHRHHKAHQKLWFGPWAHRHTEPQWKEFVKNYEAFRPQDIVVLCSYHHAEIHSLYDKIIQRDMAKLGLRLYQYSWRQGKLLMQKLEKACDEWLLLDTPGIDSKVYGETRHLRWALLSKEAKRKRPVPKKSTKKKNAKRNKRNGRRKRR